MKTLYSSLSFDERKKLKFLNIQNGNFDKFNKYYVKEKISTLKLFSPNCEVPDEFLIQNIYDARKALNFLNNSNPFDYHVCECISNSNRERRKRLRKKCQRLFDIALENDYLVLFLTLTFTDKTLNSTTYETRRKYVVRWLKDNCIHYIANIDFGKENEREHYHAIVISNCKLDYTSWKYGCLNGKKVPISKSSSNEAIARHKGRLTSYINKLSNHGLKDTTRDYKVIYSRNNI